MPPSHPTDLDVPSHVRDRRDDYVAGKQQARHSDDVSRSNERFLQKFSNHHNNAEMWLELKRRPVCPLFAAVLNG
jgi:hypothetical protein